MRITTTSTLLFAPLVIWAQMLFQEQSNPTAVVSESPFFSIEIPEDGYYAFASDSTTNFEISDVFSIEIWSKPRPFANQYPIYEKGSIKLEVFDSTDTDSYVRFSIGDEINYFRISSDEDAAVNGNKVFDNIFSHIVATYNGSGAVSGMKIYINGVESTFVTQETNGAPTAFSTDSIYIRGGVGYNRFSLYNIELSAADVATLYNGGTPGAGIGTTPMLSHSVAENDKENSVGVSGERYVDYTFPGQTVFPFRLGESWAEIPNGVRWGGASTSSLVPIITTSPIGGEYYSPLSYYDRDSGITYISTQRRKHSGYDRKSDYLRFDHTSRRLTFVSRIESIQTQVADVHMVRPLTITPQGNFLTVQENTHNSPIFHYTSSDFSQWTQQPNFGSQLAYANFFTIQDTTFNFLRQNFTNSRIYATSNGGGVWNNYGELCRLGTDGWAYPWVRQYTTDTAYLFISSREIGGGKGFNGLFVVKTGDGRNYSLLDGSITKNTVNSEFFTPAELKSNHYIDTIVGETSSTISLDILDAVIDSSGAVHVVYQNSETGQDYYIFWNGSQWTRRVMPTPYYYGDFRKTSVLIWKGGDNFDYFLMEERTPNINTVYKYETTDGFQTITNGVLMSDPTKSVMQILGQDNRRLGDPVLILGTVVQNDGAESSGLYIYEYTPQ